MVKNIIKIEGLFIFLAGIYFYNMFSGNWILFMLLIFVPDISIVGFLKNKKLGTITYNLSHNYILAIILLLVGFILGKPILTSLGLIVFSHVGIDRFLGYGLKYPSSFKDTHIQRL